MHFNRPQIALMMSCLSLLFLVFGLPTLTKLVKFVWKQLRWPGGRREPFIDVAGERLSDSDRLRHTHILGATGSGKTVLLESLIYQDLARGYGMLIVDPKGDRDLFERVKKFCQIVGRESDLHLLSANYPAESVCWNPCRLGAATEIQSKFINSWEFSEVFYAKSCEAVLLEALNAFGTQAFTIAELTERLKEISEKRKDDSSKALFLDLFNTIEGEWGELLCGKASARPEINFLDLIRRNEILFIDLPTEGKSVQSSRIGKLLLQEVMLISGMRKIYPHIKSPIPFSVYVDEFDAFATPSFATFLNKGRSSGFMIHVCHQTLSDLMRVDGGIGAFLGQVQGNINNRFFFRIDDPKDAETIASFFGTELGKKMTSRVVGGMESGDGSVRETHEFKIHPDTIKALDIGQCVFSCKTSKRLSIMKVPLPDLLPFQKKQPLLRTPCRPGNIKAKVDPVNARYASLINKNKEKTVCTT